MSITRVKEGIPEIIDTLAATDAYKKFATHLDERDIRIDQPRIYRVFGSGERYIVQFQLRSLDSNQSGILELSMTDGCVTRGLVQIDQYRDDGTLGYPDRYVLTDGHTIEKTR